jgi:hypothetical protein
MVRSRACWAKAVSLSKVMDLRSAGSIRANTASITRNSLSGSLSGEPNRKRHARFGFMENEHWPCALANEEVTLPMAALGSGVDLLGPFVDGDAILDGISRKPRPLATCYKTVVSLSVFRRHIIFIQQLKTMSYFAIQMMNSLAT